MFFISVIGLQDLTGFDSDGDRIECVVPEIMAEEQLYEGLLKAVVYEDEAGLWNGYLYQEEVYVHLEAPLIEAALEKLGYLKHDHECTDCNIHHDHTLH